MKYFTWLFTEHLSKEKQGEEKDKFRLDLVMMVGAFCLIGCIVLAVAVFELGNINYQTRMKMGEEGYRKYVEEYQMLDEDIQSLSSGWNIGTLKAKYPNLSVSFSNQEGNSMVEVQNEEISLLYFYHENGENSLELQSRLLSSEEYEETMVNKLYSFRVELWMCSILLFGGILLVISCIISIIEYLIQAKRQAVQKGKILAYESRKE